MLFFTFYTYRMIYHCVLVGWMELGDFAVHQPHFLKLNLGPKIPICPVIIHKKTLTKTKRFPKLRPILLGEIEVKILLVFSNAFVMMK